MRHIDKKALAELIPDLGNLGNLRRLTLPAESGLLRPSFVGRWPRTLNAIEISGQQSESLHLAPLYALRNLRFLALRVHDVLLDEFIVLAVTLEGFFFGSALDMENISFFEEPITLGYDTHFGSLEPLGALKKLKILCIGTTDADSLNVLEGCATLEQLYLSNSAVTDFTPLQGLSVLKSL